MKYVITVVLAVVIGVVIVSLMQPGTPEPSQITDKSMLEFTQTEHDFGVIKQSGGLVSYEFPFVYSGDVERKVTGVPTSCGCTTAEISVDTLSNGTEGVVTVTFDPNLHEEPEGKFFKTISILTEPALEQEQELKIWAEIDLDLGPEFYKEAEHDDGDEHAAGQVFHSISPDTLRAWQQSEKEFFLVDVHIPEQEHIAGTDAVIPFNEINDHLGDLPEDKNAEIVVYCRSGSMSKQASTTLTELGYTNVYDLEGGIQAYNK